ncbi:MAG TPA: hypothetical protein VJH03_20535 [Blastocatellia bacterium]|nr:hypothetical protein [Blastocatellia bacterium]
MAENTTTPTKLKIFFSGLLAFREKRGKRMQVGVLTAEKHNLRIIVFGPEDEDNYPQIIEFPGGADNLFLEIDSRPGISTSLPKTIPIDGSGFHDEPLAVKRGAFASSIFLEHGKFSEVTAHVQPVDITGPGPGAGQQKPVAFTVQAEIETNKPATLRDARGEEFFNTRRLENAEYRLYISNLEPYRPPPSFGGTAGDFGQYYNAFHQVSPGKRFDVKARTLIRGERALFTRPCLPVLLTQSDIT